MRLPWSAPGGLPVLRILGGCCDVHRRRHLSGIVPACPNRYFGRAAARSGIKWTLNGSPASTLRSLATASSQVLAFKTLYEACNATYNTGRRRDHGIETRLQVPILGSRVPRDLLAKITACNH